MIVRLIKLKPTKAQDAELRRWLWHGAAIYNYGIRKIEQDAKIKLYHTPKGFKGCLDTHVAKLDIPAHTIQGILAQAHMAWTRCFKKLGGKPKFKSKRNRFASLPFPDSIRPLKDNRVGVPFLGKVKYHKQDVPDAKIKCGRILLRASGWHMALWFNTEHTFPVKDTLEQVGIDPGFKTLATLSTDEKFENPNEYRKGEKRISQALKGRDYKLAARLQERGANQRADRNHKISRKLVENFATIVYSEDNIKGMAKKAKRDGNKKRKRFGKSVLSSSYGGLIALINYKGRIGGRTVIAVNSKNTTRTCSDCGCLSGPTGLAGLSVREWECGQCGSLHDRDTNSARVILTLGVGATLKTAEAYYVAA